MTNPFDHKDAIIIALVRRLYGKCRGGEPMTCFTAAEISRAQQCHLQTQWDDHNLTLRVIGDT